MGFALAGLGQTKLPLDEHDDASYQWGQLMVTSVLQQNLSQLLSSVTLLHPHHGKEIVSTQKNVPSAVFLK